MRAGDRTGREAARARVDAAKVALGERGPPWWTDGAPDLNRRMAKNTPYAAWWAEAAGEQDAASAPPDDAPPDRAGSAQADLT